MSGPATPLAPTSARASLPPTGSATPALPAQPAAPAMPRPEDFDILPDLHKLISHVARPDNRDALQDQSQTPGQAKGEGDSDNDKLRVEDVPEQAAKVRAKIQRARAAVMALPDIDRSLQDQEEEMADLDAHISRLKAALRDLGQPARALADDDTSMTG